jgi:hypothetical protein
VKGKRREISASDKTLEAEQKEIQEELAGFVPAGDWQVGGYRVKRSDRTRSSFKLALAEQDGRIPDVLLGEFTSRSSFSVWGVEKTGEPMLLPDPRHRSTTRRACSRSDGARTPLAVRTHDGDDHAELAEALSIPRRSRKCPLNSGLL